MTTLLLAGAKRVEACTRQDQLSGDKCLPLQHRFEKKNQLQQSRIDFDITDRFCSLKTCKKSVTTNARSTVLSLRN